MNVIIRKIGNSEGVILPKEALQSLGLKSGDSLELREVENGFQLVHQKPDLAEQLRAARIGMQKYRIALRELAK
ncbi:MULTISPECIES: AbrB/MazE/SpoVT family DNA-binding domain-containing protein [Rhizobium]|uniref:AbrB/MazE/SpoVT family DNA-binding domain-containing protein n=1 Tax=Rhizobium rhododendri TaxID=2506430 RepID=A0ABY8IKY3_9HYPH|nr:MULTISPECIES: AbrB/MazE/SpoVT family DNA-binding domain-containing protein [Rhizobium]MBO9098004.1 AbrB/MazE/SpoVT family DNA-binding domain-containing protein [Rhizobium sp. L58/93]MBO9133213.1 AbrB/MazE/SpoVT family DNA-binding domain-containing protein [Rhizobium sp. B209b/85]MBO9168155.1 AbrB/MazE/SpoVT family DNA-binding domain-containing protein [Rhizobium sp. L245/93]MBO9184200.1 AbrB/MazE/SpoVT family DNA-binding domain-containing protein [Rhizobium sp. E27B/91]MBZ5760109.1 AbrB/Maz